MRQVTLTEEQFFELCNVFQDARYYRLGDEGIDDENVDPEDRAVVRRYEALEEVLGL